MYNPLHPNVDARLALDAHNNFYIENARAGLQDDGDWDDDAKTYCACTIEDLNQLAPGVAQAAIGKGLKDCWFTTAYGALIACNAQFQQVSCWNWNPKTKQDYWD